MGQRDVPFCPILPGLRQNLQLRILGQRVRPSVPDYWINYQKILKIRLKYHTIIS